LEKYWDVFYKFITNQKITTPSAFKKICHLSAETKTFSPALAQNTDANPLGYAEF